MPQELIHIKVRRLPVQILLILLLIAAGVWSYFVVHWYLGNTLAEYFNPAENTLDSAFMAASMAPDDPLTHWRIAQVAQRTLPLDQQGQALLEYEKAVSLSPYDYRFWMSLGTAHEQSGDPVKAEMALKRAVALAPSYSYPRWYLGNLLVRNARYDEAFAELRLASQADPELLPPLFNLIWEIYGTEPEALKNAIGQSPAAKATFAHYLLQRQRFEDGLHLWDGMNAEEKKAMKGIGEAMVQSLKNHQLFHDAVRVWNDITSEKYRAEQGKVFDGSFEEAVSYSPDIVFGWQVKNAPQMQIGIDPSKSHGGERSLRLSFQVRTNIEGVHLEQLVPVQSKTEYDFECYVSTEKLETGSAPLIQIFDANTGEGLTATAMAPGGTNDWNRIIVPFKTGEKTQAVILRLVRVSCGTEEMPVCPIYGSVWYDDFSFKRRN